MAREIPDRDPQLGAAPRPRFQLESQRVSSPRSAIRTVTSVRLDPAARGISLPALATAFVATVALALAASALYAQAFGQFAAYDDQGYLIVAVGHVLDGRVPYDEVALPYGPVWLLERWVLHALLGIPETTDAVRWISVATLTLAAGAFALAVRAALAPLTESRAESPAESRAGRGLRDAAAIVTLALIAPALTSATREPGHPQELHVLLLALATWAAVSARGRSRAELAWGALAGAACLVKVNVGLFAFAACGIGSGFGTRSRLVRAASALGCVALPWLLARAHLHESDVLELAGGASLSIAALAVVLLARDREPLHARERERTFDRDGALAFASGAAGALALGLAFALARGSSLGALFHELVVAPQRLPDAFASSVPTRAGVWFVHAAGLACAALSAFGPQRVRDVIRVWVVPCARVALLALVVRLPFAPVGLFAYGASWAWVWITSEGERDPWARARATLVALAVLERLQVYPVAGSQLTLGQIAFVPLAVWGVADVVAARARDLATSARVAFGGAAASSLALLGLNSRASFEVLAAGEPISLAGAIRTHATSEDALTWRWLAHALERGPSTWVSSIGSNSLYGWSGTQPPTDLVVSHAWDLLPDEAQQRLVDALRAQRDPWIVDHPGIAQEVAHRGPFFEFVDRELEPFARIGAFTLLHRRGMPAPELEGAALLDRSASTWTLDVGGIAGTSASSVRIAIARTGAVVAAAPRSADGATLELRTADGEALAVSRLALIPPGVHVRLTAGIELPAEGLACVELLDARGALLERLPIVERVGPGADRRATRGSDGAQRGSSGD